MNDMNWVIDGEWLVREWGAFSTVGCQDRAVCLKIKTTTQFVATLTVCAIGAVGWGQLNRPQTFALVG